MKDYRTMLWILMGIGSILVIPFVAANIRYGGVFPDGYFAFPLTEAPAKPGFELWWKRLQRLIQQCLAGPLLLRIKAIVFEDQLQIR